MIKQIDVVICDRCERYVQITKRLLPGYRFQWSVPNDWHEEKCDGSTIHLCAPCFAKYKLLSFFIKSEKKKA